MSRALSPSGLIPAPAVAPVRKYGLVTVETHRHHKRLTGEDLHAYIDGVDVTRWVCRCDDREGWIELIVFTKDADPAGWLARGGYYVGEATIRIAGDVRIAPEDL